MTDCTTISPKALWINSPVLWVSKSLRTCYSEAGEEATIRGKPRDEERIGHQPCFLIITVTAFFLPFKLFFRSRLWWHTIAFETVFIPFLSLTLSILLKKGKCYPGENSFELRFFYLRKKPIIEILKAKKIPFNRWI